MADHVNKLGLGLVGRLGSLPGAAFCREAVDESLDLRKEILRPKVFRSHDRSPTLVSKPVSSLAEIT